MRLFRRKRKEDRGGGEGEPPRPRGLLGATRAALAPVRKRHVVIASMGFMGVAVIGVFLFSAVSFWWTSQPSFCGRCHVMDEYLATWSASPHRDVNCEECHLNPGFFGFMGGKVAGLQVVMNYIRGTYEDYSFSAAVSNASCLQCHRSLLDRNFTDPETKITVSHFHIIENGGKCMDCHSTVAHQGVVPPGSANYPTMDRCMRCHDGVLAPTTCTVCHPSGAPAAQPPTDVRTTAADGGG